MIEVDCRKLPCPAPLIVTKKTLEDSNGEPVTVLADYGAAQENIIRMAKSRGFIVTEETAAEHCRITISPGMPLEQCEMTASDSLATILIASDRLGDGADELGRLLMKNFVITLLETDSRPSRIFLLNSGVLLATEGSELAEPLQRLAAAGVEIMSCGVCLDYFAVRDKLAVGTITNMYTIAEAMLAPGKAIRI